MTGWLAAIASLAGALLFLASPVAAQPVTGHAPNDDFLQIVFVGSVAEARIGDRGETNESELLLGQQFPIQTGQFDLMSDEIYSWTLSYEPASIGGTVRFSFEGTELIMATAAPFNSFFIRTYAERPDSSILVNDLVLGPPPSAGGGGLTIFETTMPGTPASSAADGNGADLDVLKISGVDLLVGFTLQGRVEMVFAQADPQPTGEQLSFKVFVADDGNPPGVTDSDGDGIPDDEDNCPNKANADQANNDSDDLGDVCDNCPEDFNPPGPDGKQPNEDGDKFGDACDNCPLGCTPVEPGTCKIDDGTNSDGDIWGDRCDNCPGIANDDQADANGNGKGNLCDDNKIIWDNLPTVAPAFAGSSFAAFTAQNAVAVTTTVELFIDCSTDVAFANIGINLSNTMTMFGDFSNCLLDTGGVPNPNEKLCTNADLAKLGPTISTASSVIGPGIQSVSYPWLLANPSVTADPPGVPADMVILQLHGAGGPSGNLICEAQDENVKLGVVRLQDFIVGSNPLSNAGFNTFDPVLTQLVGPAGPVPDEQVVFQVNPPGTPLISIELRPTDANPDTHYELSIRVDLSEVPPQEVARIAFGLTSSQPVGLADVNFGGCQDVPVANTPAVLGNSVRGCQGNDPSQLSPRVDDGTQFASDGSAIVATYTVGPDTLVDLQALGSSRLPDTLYVALDSGFVEDGDDILNSAGSDQWLGVVVFDANADPPQITFQGIDEFPGYEVGSVVSVVPGQITGENVTLSNTFSTSSDTDGDSVPDDLENCTRVPNPDQANTGGVGFVTSVDNFDNIGNACQCADPGRDGVADNGSALDAPEEFDPQDDVVKCQEALSGQQLPQGENSDFCKVTTTEGSFSIIDVVVLEADTAVPGSSGLGDPKTGSLQNCPAQEGQL